MAFHSEALKGKSLHLSTYEKELLALVKDVKRWRPNLVGRTFLIKIDQQSLKLLLEQRVGNLAQQKWLTKLLGYSFVVEYKRGKENKAADALSRRSHDSTEHVPDSVHEASLFLISFPCPLWLDLLKDSYNSDITYQQLLSQLADSSLTSPGFSLQNGLILYKKNIFLSSSSPLKPLILQHVHDSPIGGHFGYLKTLHWIKQDFFWKGMKTHVKQHIKCCEVCQRIKVHTTKPAGLLQTLLIPNTPWLDTSMDFIECLPKSHGFEVLLVVVDRLTKFVRFLPLSHPFTAARVAAVFMKGVFKLHGMPKSIVSDKGAVFSTAFWKELFKLQGTTLATSLVYHP